MQNEKLCFPNPRGLDIGRSPSDMQKGTCEQPER